MNLIYIHYASKCMRNSKRWVASLLAVLLIIQSFSTVDFGLFQVQAAYANADNSYEQSLTSAQDTGEMQGGETSSDIQKNSETTQNNGTESVTASTGELKQTGEANLFGETISTNFAENTTQATILIPSDGTDTTNDVLTDNSTLVTTSAAIAVPANVSANVYNNQTISVIWESVDGADGYEVSLNDNVYSTSSFTHTFYSLDSNTPYTIKVRAVNNDVCSDWSPDIVKYTLLDTPKNLVVTTSSSISVSLAWDAVPGATRYEIYRNSSLIGSSLSNSYTDNTVSADLTYKYKVKAYNDTGNVSNFSSYCSIITSTTVPSKPVFSYFAVGEHSIFVSWGAVAAATGYEVSLNGNITSMTTPYYDFDDLEPNIQYVIKVRAVNHVGSGEWSEEISKYTLLGTPSNIRAVPSNTSVSLAWDAVLGATYYEIYRDDSLISTSNTNKYSELGLTENVTYTYKIKACNENNASELSESYTATTLMVPATPVNVNIEATSETLTIGWDSIADAGSYEISVNGNTTIVNTNNHTFDGLQSNALYKFRVRAINAGEYGDWSEEKSSYTLLTTPVNLSTTTASAISVNLIWDAVAGATKYDVYRDNSKITSVYTNKYTDTGLTANTSYTYSVKAYNDYNESAESNIITATTQELKITSFSFNSLNPKAIGTIDQQAKIITVLVSPYVNVKELAATFTASTTTVKVGTTEQISGVTINDFTNPVTYTVISNGLEVNYTVKVTKVESYGAGFIQVCAGDDHTVALKGDGTVWAWGYNGSGQLGDGTRDKSAVPVKVANISGIKAIASGLDHTIALKEDGTVWAWGDNYYGQLGDGTTIYSNIPVKVAGMSGVKSIYAGGDRNIVIKEDGTVWAWGDNRDGRLGDGTNENSKTPIKINGLTGVTEISVGLCHTVAVKEDGTVWAWGLNSYGQFGDGIYNGYSMVPKQITGISGVKAVAAGGVHTLLLKEDGTVWASGDNPYGQLGNGTKSYSCTPIQVVGIDGGVKEIAAGEIFSVALKEDGTVWTWGADDYGQLCNGSGGSSISPLKVPGANSVKAITAGFNHTSAIQDNGMLLAWGRNDDGQLGDGTICDDYQEMLRQDIPVQVLNNIAYNKPLTTSLANVANNEHNVVDSNKTTNCSFSKNNETEWFSIDLQNKYSINKVKLIWDENYYISYNIKVSEDGSNWTDICSGTLDYFDVNDIYFSLVIGRYIRIDFSDKFIDSEYSLSEIEVYGKAIPPVFTPAVGFSDSAQTVTLSCTTEGAEIRYTTNGTMPNSRSNLYSGPITIGETTTIKACAIKAGIIQSDTACASYFIETDTIQPTAPSNLSASSITTKKAALSWTASTDNIGIALYEIYCNGSKVGESNKTSFTCTDLVPGTSYTFSVKAVDLANNISEASNELIVNTVVDDYSDDFVSAISLQAGVKLSGVINALGDEDIFRFIPSADGLYNIKIVSSFDSYGYLYDDSGLLIMSNNDTENKDFLLSGNLLANQTYFVKVTCNNNSGTGEYDLIVNYIENQAPTAPENFVLTSQNDGTVYFTWSPSTDNVEVTGYELYRDGKLVNKFSADIWQCSDTGLSPLSTYSYTMKAFDAAGNKSVNSQTVSVTTGEDIQAPTAPTEIVAPLINARSLILSWTASSDNFNVARYEIYNGTSKIATSEETNCALTGLTPGTIYTFTVKAVDSADNVSSASNFISVKTLDDDYGDDITSAEQITIGTKISAVINCSGDVDFFKFTPTVNGVYNIFTDNWSSKGYLYNDNGTLIYTGPYCAGISAILETNNTYYLKVEGEIGNYNLNVLYVDDDYGNDMNSAGLINIGSSLSAVKNYEQDVDFFKFTPAIDGTYIINVNGQYPTISLYDNDGVLMSSSGSPTATMLTKDRTYYIKVKNYSIGNYSVEVSYVDTQAPSAPTDFTVFQINDGTVTLVWSSSTDNVGVAGYKLYRDGLLIKTITGQINECVDTGLSLDTSYYYTLKAYDVEGNKSLDSEILCVTTVNYDTQPPTAPADIAASYVTARSVRLTWTASTDNFNVERYDIYHESSKIATSSVTNCTLTGLTPATSYTFMIRAVDAAENISPTSSAIKVTTLEDDYGDDISSAVAINAETDVSGVINFNGDWDFFKFTPIIDGNYKIENISNINTYGYLYTSDGAVIANASKSGNNSGFLISSNLTAGETYYVAVKHYYNYGTGTYTLKISYIDTLAPSTPENLAILSKDNGTVHLTWSPATDNIGVTGYELYRDGNLIKTVNGDVLQYSDTGLTPHTTYSYTVKAFDAAGNRSLDSQPLSVTTDNDDEAPTAPTNLAASSITARSLILTWTASTDNYNVARYEIYNKSSKISTLAETNCKVTGLIPGTTYTFMVKAVDSSENISTTSGAITVTTLNDDYGDDISSAAAINAETDVSGVINFNGDLDFFKFIPLIDGGYRIKSIGNTDTYGYLYSNDGTLIAQDDQSGDNNNFLISSDFRAGQAYYIAVKHWNSGTGAYILRISYIDTLAPTTPENLAILSKDDGTVHLTWSPATDNIGVTGYELYRDGNLIKTLNGDVLQYSDTGLNPHTTYSYTVKAFDAAGNRSLDNQPLIVTTDNDDEAPTAPTNLAASSITARSLTLTWTASTDNFSVARYEIYNQSSKVATSTATNCTVTGLTPATSYTFMVKAVDSSENISTTSGAITVTTLNDDYGDDISSATAINAETDVSGVINFNGDLDFFMFIPIIDGSYRIKSIGNTDTYGNLYSSDNTLIAQDDDSGDNNNFLISSDFRAGQAYYIAVKHWGSGTGSYILKISYIDTLAPSAPENLAISSKDDGTVYFTWTPATDNIGVTGYELYRNGNLVKKVDGNTCQCSDAGLNPLTTYSYTIKAFDAEGNRSLDSQPLSVTTDNDDEAPTAPTNLAASSITASSLILTWTASTDNFSVARYEIYNETSKVATSTATNCTVTGLIPGTTYTFMAKAVDMAGCVSTTSAAIVVTTLGDVDYDDNINSATAIDIGVGVYGVINFANDVDCFKFTPTVDGSYAIIGSTNSYYIVGYLYDSNEVLITSSRLSSNLIMPALKANTTYYLKIKGYNSTYTGQYKINVVKAIPDIIITDISPKEAYLGQPVQFSVTVKNQGLIPIPAGSPYRIGLKINDGETILWSENGISALAVGASSILTMTSGISGSSYAFENESTYKITAIADDTNIIEEIDETNNILVKTICIGKPDLIITNLSPTTAYPGQPIIFSAVVKNQGQVSTISGKPFRVGFKANGGDITVWTADYTKSIAPGGTVTLVATAGVNGASFIFTTPGAIQITAYVDDDNRLEESNEDNNTYNKSITIYEPADLIVSDIMYSPQNPSVGEDITFSAKIRNIGLGDTLDGVSHRVGFKIDNGNTIIWSDSYTTSIKKGESVTVSATGGNTGSTWKGIEGIHDITAIVDDLNTIFEENEQNNTYTERMAVLPPCDLVVTKILLSPANPIIGEPVTISATIKNIGNSISPAGRTHRVGFKIDGGATSIWADDYDWSIATGSSITVKATSGTESAVWNAIAGEHTITAVVDDMGLINESNETNNSLIKDVTVTEKRIFDPNADYDEDGIINSLELILGTEVENPDTDGDKLSDGEEQNTYHTNPLSPDTDGDGIYDETEIKISSDPLVQNENISVTRKTETLNQNITVTVNGDSNVYAAPFQVVESDNMILNSLSGIVGKPADISLGGYSMTSADITFKYSEDELQGTSPENLTVFWVDTENSVLVPLSNDKVTIDSANHTVTGEVSHFSTYILGHKDMKVDLANVDIVFVIDQSGSMSWSDPNYYRLKAVKRFVQDIDTLKNRAGIVAFESSGYIKQSLTNNKAQLNSVLDSMRYDGGGTDILDGLTEADAVFGSNNANIKAIVLLTDGEDGNGAADLEKARYLSTQRKIMINTVALGTDADVSLLQGMAGVGNGSFFYINNQNGLTQQQVDAQIELLYVKLVKMLTLTKNNKYNFNPQQKMAIDYADKYLGVDYDEAVRLYTQANANMLTGNYLEQAEDMAIDGPGPELKLERTYNSADKDVTTIGRGWRLNYDSKLRVIDGAYAVSGKVIANNLNVRTYPYGTILTTLGKGKEVTYITKNAEKDSDGKDWHLVRLQDGVTGYVASWYISDISGVEVTYGSGTKILFDKKDSNGNYITPYGTFDKLTKNTSTGIYTLVRKDKSQYKYDGSGKLISIEDKNGNTLNITYTGAKISKVTDQAGRSLTFTYPDSDHVKVTDPADRYVEYVLDSNKNLVSVFDPSRHKTQYTYYSGTKNGSYWSRLEKELDALENQVVKNDYDEFGRLVRQYDVNNYVKYHIYRDVYKDEKTGEYVKDKNGKIELSDSYINERGFESKITYNLAEKRPITEEDSENKKTSHKYFIKYNNTWTEITNMSDTDSNAFYKANWQTIENGNWPTREEITDRNGNTTIYEKDNRGNIVNITNPDGSYQVFNFDSNDNLYQKTDEANKATYYIYDANGINLKKQAQPLNGTDEYTLEADQTKFAVTAFEYYTDSEASNLGYNYKGLLKSVTDPELNKTTYEYNAYGKAETVTHPDSTVERPVKTTYDYNNLGWEKYEISPKGNKTEYARNQNGEVVRIIQNANDVADNRAISRINYDVLGRKTKEISANQYDSSFENTTTYAYDGDHGYRYTYYDDGRVHTVKDPENNETTYTYDPSGNVDTEVKPNGSVYKYEYDSLNRLTKIYFKETEASSPVLLEENIYAILSNKNTQTTNKKYLNDTDVSVTVSVYDYAGRLISQTNPDGTSNSTYYNANGTINYTKDRKDYITYYKYDGLNRLTEQWTPFEKVNDTVKYTYQKIVYDNAGNKLKESTWKTTVAKDVVPTDVEPTGYISKNYVYYANGKVDTITQSDETGTVFGKTKYEYDADGNISKEIVYTDADNTNITEYNYNYMGKVSEKKVHVKAGDIEGNDFSSTEDSILSTSYTYDKNGNLKTITTPDAVITTYTYDNMNRQTGVSQPGIDEYLMSVTISSSTDYDWQGNKVKTTDANKNDTEYFYNKRGLLEKTTTKEKDALGNIVKTNTTAFYYDRAGRLTAEVAAKDYDPAKTLEQMNRVEYTYDLMGRVKTKTYVGEEKRVHPTNFGWTTQQVAILQKAYKYDANGNVIKELDALGYEAATDKTGIDTKINTGYGTEYTYNLANKQDTVLYAETKAKGFTSTIEYSYDALGRTISELNSRGAITKYSYDGAGNVVSVAVNKLEDTSDQIIKTSTYDYTGKLLTETNMQSATKGSTTEYEYNALGQVRKAVYPSDASIPESTVKYQYDVMGRLKTQWDTKGAVDAYTYNNQGDVLSHTQKKQDNTEEITTLTRYDENGNARFVFDGNKKCTTYTYNEQNKVKTSSISASGIAHETTYTYDANGNQIAVTDWRGNTTTYVYDSLNRLIETIDAKQNSIQKLEYNRNNVQEKSYDALNKATVYTYDRNNRLLTTKDPGNHTTSQTYNSIGNLATKTDGRGNITNYYYDEFNRLETVINAKNETTDYTYDLSGNLLTQKDGKGNTTTYEYNVANKAIKRVDQGGRTGTEGNYTYIPAKTETYTYYADGSLASKTDREGNTTVYVYDIHGRLQSQSVIIQNTTESAISFTYDDNGNQLTMTDSTGTTIRTYDELGRVLTKTVPDIGTSYFQYDIISGMDEGCYAEITTDPKGHVTQKIFDKVGRLITVTAGGKTTTYNYYNNGARESVTYNDGTKDTAIEEYTYYGDGLLWTLTNTKLDAAGNTIIDSYSYTYDAAHNQTSKTDAKGVTSYTYDVLNRLETVTEPSGTLEAPSTTTTAYTYDAAGNRETETITKGTQITVNTYIYNEQNRLTRVETKVNGTLITTTEYAYDYNGNQLTTTVNGAITVNEYDCWNQLITTMTNTGTTINAYNGEGYRVSKTVNGTLTRYLYEGDKVVLELDNSGNETARNVYGSNLIMREAIRPDNSNIFDTYFYLYNGHADVTALLKPDGNIAATYYYDAFGNITATGSANNSITFAGYQYDAETGLYYLNARMYDPKTARFLQEDTYLGDRNDPLSLNLYTYCHNEPLMYTDPTGHNWMDSAREWFLKDTKVGQWVDKNIYKPVEKKAKDFYNYVDKKAPALTGIGHALYKEVKTIQDSVDIVERVKEAYKVVTRPKETIDQIKTNYINVFSNPQKTFDSVCKSIDDYVDSNIINGNAHTRAEFGTHATVFVASLFVGAGEAKAAKTVADGAKVAGESISKLSRFKNTTSVMTNKLLKSESGSTNIFNKMFDGLINRGTAGVSEAKSSIDLTNALSYRSYIRDIEANTGRKIPMNQIRELKNALKSNNFEKLDEATQAAWRSNFDSAKPNLRSSWEQNTNQSWPRYNQPVINNKGSVLRRPGNNYDAHEIIPNAYGGPLEWWNVHPAKFPGEHQGGIHRGDGIWGQIFGDLR